MKDKILQQIYQKQIDAKKESPRIIFGKRIGKKNVIRYRQEKS